MLWMLPISVGYAAIQGEEVDYKEGDVTFKGYIAYDDAIEGPRPGVIVVHEWWGHNDYVRKRADMLASLGYTALAIDMYGDGKVAQHPDDAGKFAGEVMSNMDQAKARFLTGLELLRKHPMTNSDQIAAIGYCFGGGTVLNMARMGVDLKGVVSFHGSLGSKIPAEAGQVKAKILVCHGGEDQFVTPEQIDAFKTEMDAAKVGYQFIVYEGAKHSFTNPDADMMGEKFNLPIGYNADADQASWQDMQNFFSDIFSNKE